MTEFEEYSSYLYEREDEEKFCGDDQDLDDDNHNDNHHDIEREGEL